MSVLEPVRALELEPVQALVRAPGQALEQVPEQVLALAPERVQARARVPALEPSRALQSRLARAALPRRRHT